jgi:thiosulfate dehydrogenase (quinone) large subunit
VLLPLRAFLGFTFCFAGLQKLANPDFFNSASPSGIQASLIAAERISPLHPLLGHLLKFAVPIGILIALGELAVGIGTLLGLWARAAAVGGLILSLTLFLTVSWHASPYYTGADIVFVFAWLPMIVAGSGGVLSLDGLIAARARQEHGEGPPNPVTVPFSVIQEVCGHYEEDRCRARGGLPCDVRACPFLLRRQPVDVLHPDGVDRRTLVLGGAAVVAAGAAGLVAAGTAAAIGNAVGGAPRYNAAQGTLPGPGSPAPSTTAPSNSRSTTVPSHPKGKRIGPAVDVPVGGSAGFTDPASGDPAIVLQLAKGSFLAYDAVCPHAGCTVAYQAGAQLIVCPCHGSEFNPSNGDVIQGPAPTGLRHIAIAEGGDGQLYVDG